MEHLQNERAKFLQVFLDGVQYTLPSNTIVSVSFLTDDAHATKLWLFERMMREFYGAYATGPASIHVPGETNYLSFGFRNQENLNLARRELKLPAELQAGPRT